MSLIKDYFVLASKYESEYGKNTIVLLQVGAFFEVYGQTIDKDNNKNNTCTGSRIDDFCVICELAKANKIPGILMAGFRDYGLDKYLKKLQDAGYTAVVYIQDGTKTPPTRHLQGIYSPGTYFSMDVNCEGGSGSSNLSNNIACIWIDKIHRRKSVHSATASSASTLIMGMTNIDIYTGRSTIFESENTDSHNPTTYDEVERFISSYNPTEVIIISNLSTREIEDVIHYANIHAKMVHKIFIDTENNKNSDDNNNKNDETISALSREQKAIRCTKQIYKCEVLNVFFPEGHSKSIEHSFLNYEIATQSLVFLLNFIYEHNPNLVSKIQEPIFENMSDRLILANHSLRQLNIIDDGNACSGSNSLRTSSVIRLLNHTITPMGSRAYKYALLHPTFNESQLQREYDITEYMLLNNSSTSNSSNNVDFMMIREKLTNMKDIEKLHRQIILRKITPYHCYSLFHNLVHIREIYTTCSIDSVLSNYLTEHMNIKNNIVGVCTSILDLFEKTLDINSCQDIADTTFENNIIRRGISADLDKVVDDYNRSMKTLDGIQRVLNEYICAGEKPAAAASVAALSNSDIDYVKIHETDKMGISLQATKRRTKLLEEKIKKLPNKSVTIANTDDKTDSFVFDLNAISYPVASGSNNTIHSQQIYELCASIISCRHKMSSLVSQIYYSFITSLHTYYHDFENMIAFISTMDILQNRCYIARKYHYCKPVISNTPDTPDTSDSNSTKSFVNARGLRHCLIERINNTETYITNDVSLGGSGTGALTCDGMLLYGTNAVGKTSLIRAIGISIIMAQAGFYVPASSFVFRPYKSLMTRIIGNDNLFKGLSTFVVEMTELRVILRMANENTIVLGDELCSGTEIDSAISIFVAGLKHLHNTGSSYIFATHLHEIAEYSEILEMMPRLRLAHMRVFYDKSHDTLVYDRKLQDGAGDSMYGLEVCKSLHLPDEFLEYANSIRVKYRGVNSKTPTASILEDATPSRYNAAKLRRVCELCEKKRGTEVHHLQHQENADSSDYIGNMHKNHAANLATLCEECHQNIHKSGIEHIKVKTGKGAKIVPKKQ